MRPVQPLIDATAQRRRPSRPHTPPVKHAPLRAFSCWPAPNPGCPAPPHVLQIDYVRVYQPKGSINLGCSPPDYPTAQYLAW